VIDEGMSTQHWWNGTDRGKKYSEITCTSATSPTTNITWTSLGKYLDHAARGRVITAWAMA